LSTTGSQSTGIPAGKIFSISIGASFTLSITVIGVLLFLRWYQRAFINERGSMDRNSVDEPQELPAGILAHKKSAETAVMEMGESEGGGKWTRISKGLVRQSTLNSGHGPFEMGGDCVPELPRN
jgi:hypothetical protein